MCKNMDIRHFSLMDSYIKKIEKNILELGFREGLCQAIEKPNSRFLVFGKDEIKEILTEAPVIIAFNHTHEIETIVYLAALTEREDIFLIATQLLKRLLPAIGRHLISVYVRQKNPVLRKISDFIPRTFVGKKEITFEEKHQKNIQSINEAAEKVKQGGSIMIAPNPDNKEWRSGIGWLVSDIGSMEQAYYIKVHVVSNLFFDYLRLIPGLGRILPAIKIYFGQPIKLSKIWQRDGKKLTFELEKEYNEWVKSLNK